MKPLAAFVLATCVASAFGQPAHTPKTGSAERKAILDGIRPLAEKKLKQKLIFQIQILKVASGYAFVTARPLRPNGKPLDWKKTPYWSDIQEGAFDEQVMGLLKKSGSKWRVLEWTLGATDFPALEWVEKHRAPKSILPS